MNSCCNGRYMFLIYLAMMYLSPVVPLLLNDPYPSHIDPYILQTYRLCTKNYLANGKDGYLVFKDCPVLVSNDDVI